MARCRTGRRRPSTSPATATSPSRSTAGPDASPAPGGAAAPAGAPPRRPTRVSVVEPAHHGAKLGAGLLDRRALLLLATLEEVRTARVELRDEFLGERAVLDLAEDLAH